MSGGAFDYNQYKIDDIVDEIKCIMSDKDFLKDFTDETKKEFEKGIEILKKAEIYAQRIDWLVCGDDGEECFHRRLKEDLNQLTGAKNDKRPE